MEKVQSHEPLDWWDIWCDFQAWQVTDPRYTDVKLFLQMPVREVLEFHSILRRKRAVEANIASSATAKGFAAIGASLGAKKVNPNHFLPYDPDLLDTKSRKFKLLRELSEQSCAVLFLLLKQQVIPPHVEAAFKADSELWEAIVHKGKKE